MSLPSAVRPWLTRHLPWWIVTEVVSSLLVISHQSMTWAWTQSSSRVVKLVTRSFRTSSITLMVPEVTTTALSPNKSGTTITLIFPWALHPTNTSFAWWSLHGKSPRRKTAPSPNKLCSTFYAKLSLVFGSLPDRTLSSSRRSSTTSTWTKVVTSQLMRSPTLLPSWRSRSSASSSTPSSR